MAKTPPVQTELPDTGLTATQETELHGDILRALLGLEYDAQKRNLYMRKRYDALYLDGLYRDLDIDGWFAENNLVARVVDIMTAQLFGRGFDPVSTYSKEDLEAYEQDPQAKQAMQLKNKKLKADADMRHRIMKAMITDNGGMATFEKAGNIGSGLGTSVMKMWPDTKNKKIIIKVLESVQNYRAGWSDDDFRERDFDAYVWQISEVSATRQYGSKLAAGEVFTTTAQGMPLGDDFGGSNTSDPINQTGTQGLSPQTQRQMVSAIDFTGYLPGWGVVNKKVAKVDRGKETKISVFDVGGKIVQTITNEKKMPRYYVVNNREIPRQAWGAADISDSLIDINTEIVRLMADEMEWADKNLWKILLGHGLTQESLAKLKGKKRKTKLLAVSPEQNITEVATTSQPLSEFERLINQKLDMFVRLSGVGRVLFDDPTVNANSNAALMTTMKGVVDVVESKQKRWEPVLINMFTDALELAAEFTPGLREALDDDPDWTVGIEWPTILRKEDASYQTMLLNQLNRGVISVETYMQKALQVPDTGEELDRITDEMNDPVSAAILGNIVGELANIAVKKAAGIPPGGYNQPKVTLKGELAPQEVGNIASQQGWDKGPFGAVIGPTGMDGAIAADNFLNSGMTTGDVRDGGTGNYKTPQQANPTLSAGENQAQPASMPGSGAPAVSPAGAAAASNQQHGG